MLWLHAVLLFAPYTPPPCHPSDVHRFPPCIHVASSSESESYYPEIHCPAIEARLDWLRANQAWGSREVGEWNDLDEQIDEQVRIEGTWGYLFRARWLTEHDGDPSWYLEKLREQLGEKRYAAGKMPNPIPLHRYYEVPPR